MPFAEELTIPQHILCAAARLREPFHLNELVVAAWKASPSTFGLEGFEKIHPDNNRVAACLAGSRGLVAKGNLERVRPKTYRLTDRGRKEAGLAQAGVRHAIKTSRLPVAVERRLLALTSSYTLARFVGGMGDFIGADQADLFLKMDPAGTVRAARAALVGGVVTVEGGEVKARALDQIEQCHAFVVRKFNGKLQTVGV